MKNLIFIFLIFTSTLYSNILDEYNWKNRVVIIFGDDPFHAKVKDIYKEEYAQLKDRDIIWIEVGKNNTFNDLKDKDFYDYYNINNSTNRFLLIGKDGGVKLSRDDVVSPSSLYSIIDVMPMRMREMME